MNINMTAGKTELKPCPFCGGEAAYKAISASQSRLKYSHGYIGCSKCKVYMQWVYEPSGAAKKWNRRTTE